MRAILLLSALLTLCACSKEDVETANFGSDYFKADYQLINATPLELDFYIANSALDGDARDPFADKYKVAHLPLQHDTQQLRHEHNSSSEVSLYVHAPYQDTASYRQTYKVKRAKHYQWLAWRSGSALAHTLIERQLSNQRDVIRVRLFATAANLFARQQGTRVRLSVGAVSEYFSITQCDSGLYINEQAVDVCDAAFGQSYLLVVGAQGRISLVAQ